MSDRLQRISDNAGRIYAALWVVPNPEKMVQDKTAVAFVVGIAIQIEQEVAKQSLAAFKAKPASLPDPRVCPGCFGGTGSHTCGDRTATAPCTCEEVPGDHARCPIHGES